MLRLRDRDVAHAVEHSLDADACFRTSERRAGAGVDAVPERDVLAGVHPIGSELVGVLEAARVAVGRPGDHHHRGAGGDVDAADGGRHPRQPEVTLHRALEAQGLLDEARDAIGFTAEQVLEVGPLAEEQERGGEQADGGLLAGGEQVGGDAHDVDDLGQRPVRERRGRQAGQHVVGRIRPSALDVLGELGVEELERVVPQRLLAAPDRVTRALRRQLGSKHLVILLGHPEQIRDHQHCERARELADELAAAIGDEFVDLAVGEPPDELLVLAEALRRDQPHQQRAMRRVHGRVEGRELVAHRELVAVSLDERAHVVTGEGHREAGEGPGHGVARGEGRGVVEHRDRLVVAGDHHHVLMRLAPHGAFRPEELEVGIRILDERMVDEEIGPVEVSDGFWHRIPPCRRVSQFDERRYPAGVEQVAAEIDRDLVR